MSQELSPSATAGNFDSDASLQENENQLSRDEFHDEFHDERFQVYRSLSKSAVFSVIFAVMALVGGILSQYVLVLAVLGLAFGLLSLGKIRRFPDELSGRGLARFGIALSLLVGIGGTTTYSLIYAFELPDGYERVSFSLLGKVAANQRMPAEIAALDGKRVFIKGYVHPGVQTAGDVRQFVLVGDMGTCCFGGQPKLGHMVDVKIVSDDTIRYGRFMRKLGGTLRLVPPGKPTVGKVKSGIYQLEADYVR